MSYNSNLPKVYPRSWHSVQGETKLLTSDQTVSVMTYNILNDTCIPDGMYDYCDKSIRYMQHRHLHIREEIKHFNPDIVCMQVYSPFA